MLTNSDEAYSFADLKKFQLLALSKYEYRITTLALSSIFHQLSLYWLTLLEKLELKLNLKFKFKFQFKLTKHSYKSALIPAKLKQYRDVKSQKSTKNILR